MILAVGSIRNPSYVPTNWQTFLLTVLIMIVQSFLSSMPTRWIANFNSVGTVVNIACLLITIIIIPAASKVSPKFQPNSFAWGIDNLTDFPDGIAVMMSFLAIAWTMSGYGRLFPEMPSPIVSDDQRLCLGRKLS
jgi:amino acid transporter